jgi:hypothetical protein
MRKFVFAAVAALLVPAAALAETQDFTFINSTGYVVQELYVSPSRANNWEEDVLGADRLASGQRTTIRFNGDSDACLYDIKLVHDDGDSASWTGINLCEVSVVNARYNKDGEPIADYE